MSELISVVAPYCMILLTCEVLVVFLVNHYERVIHNMAESIRVITYEKAEYELKAKQHMVAEELTLKFLNKHAPKAPRHELKDDIQFQKNKLEDHFQQKWDLERKIESLQRGEV